LNHSQYSISDCNEFYRLNTSTENDDESYYIKDNVASLALNKQANDHSEYKQSPRCFYSNCQPVSSSSTTRSTLHPSSCLTLYQCQKRHSFGSNTENISSMRRANRQDSLRSCPEFSSSQMDIYYPNIHVSGSSSGTSSYFDTGDSSSYGIQSNMLSYRKKGICHAFQTTKY